MKNVLFGAVLAAAATAAIASPAQAASLAGTGISSNGGWAFEVLLPTNGGFKSEVFIAKASDPTTRLKTLFVENAFGEPNSNITPSNGKNSFTFADGFDPSESYILGLFSFTNENNLATTETIFSDSTPKGEFKSIGFDPIKGTLFGWDDSGANDDRDFNDINIYVRAVPVPGLIPGVALAGAFIVARSRKRKEATKA